MGEPPTRACALGLLNTLPLQYAEVLKAVGIQGQAVQQVAGGLGITPNSLSVRLYRARQALRLKLLARCGVDSRKTCLQCDCECAPSFDLTFLSLEGLH